VTDAVVRIEQARFGYGGHVAAAADLQIQRGEVVALLGPNGSGKTTLLKGMLGLVERLGGSVEVFDRPVEHLLDRSAIGYLPQRQSAAGPIPVTVRELVRSGLLARSRPWRPWGHRPPGAAVAIDRAIATVGLTDQAHRAVARLSGGQQRRALFARALVGGADLLLADEPFAGVDQENQHAIADAVALLVDRGATVVVVLHELGPLEPIATRAICMDAGRVLFDGPLAQAPPGLLHLGHDHDPHGGEPARTGLGLLR
jgi:zinc transport system ATP-binding protein